MPSRPAIVPGLYTALAAEGLRRSQRTQNRTGATLHRDDPYLNTSLEEQPPLRHEHTLPNIDGSDDEEVRLEGGADRYADPETLLDDRRDRTEMDQEKKVADAKGDELTLHYRKEERAKQAVRVALQQLEQRHPGPTFANFKKHLTNAMIISAANVRVYDILSWAMPSVPADFRKPFIELQTYYHQEARLWYELAVLERREKSIDGWSEDHQYGAERFGKAHYGYETIYRPNGLQDFRVRFEGRLQLKHMLAGLEAREVRLTFAAKGERHGERRWEEFGCLDRKVMTWIEAAEAHLERSFSAITTPATSSSNAGPLSTTKPLATAVRLTAKPDVDAYYTLVAALTNVKAKLEKRKNLVSKIRALRSQHAKDLAAFEKAVDGGPSTVVPEDIEALDAELKKLVQKIDAAEQELTAEVGVGWEID
ncbi:hypothetical protein LTR85_008992 [Meristemomyces frigidus]|nr:hypothetical protein LTR85_008992 [Meristemomyces frigidus]